MSALLLLFYPSSLLSSLSIPSIPGPARRPASSLEMGMSWIYGIYGTDGADGVTEKKWLAVIASYLSFEPETLRLNEWFRLWLGLLVVFPASSAREAREHAMVALGVDKPRQDLWY
ncbi:hypothetical protein SISNIDRAFT_494527 [Sistotremastrum niveocremeum HHB9708]|uniref:Uncharacterized protein n=1 Tax=Sistotremastrum niveocremeum HHB9708 TaxID=1314777 RepID=A0A164WJL7_9AGAM|nr:hypothetical protein SISNIDRAFT_494527 [Sistotremastrum niveocremeum HHB9708]